MDAKKRRDGIKGTRVFLLVMVAGWLAGMQACMRSVSYVYHLPLLSESSSSICDGVYIFEKKGQMGRG